MPRDLAETEDGPVRVLLSDGAPIAGPAAAGNPLGAARPLSDEQADALLARLAPLDAPPADRQPFALREDSLPPPQTGADLRLEPLFPAAEAPAPPAATAGPPAVLRRSPEGEVELAAQLSVTFSQPMVAVGSHEAAAATIPARLTPQPPGRWRWVGSQTLLFEADGHLPMATAYEAVVPAGARSAAGEPLAAEVRWSFGTPPPRLISSYPAGEPQRRDQPIFLGFDQRIDPEAVAGGLELRADGRRVPARLAGAAEIAADPRLQALADRHQRGRWLAVVPAAPLPADAEISVIVPPGTPSAEGPRLTAEAQSFGFRTFGPLLVTGQRCGRMGGACIPWEPWTIELSNPLDEGAFSPEQVRIEPPIAQADISASGSRITIHGVSQPRTDYEVTLAAELADAFGQTLGEPATLAFKVGMASPVLVAPGGSHIILDPAGPRSFSVYSANHPRLTARLFAVGPEHWGALHEADPPGRLAATLALEPAGRPDELVESRIDLAPALDEGLGQVLVVVEPDEQPQEHWGRQRVTAWLQSTNLGLALFAERGGAVVWASDLADGAPAAGVEVAVGGGKPSAVTGADGLARIDRSIRYDDLIVARRGRDVALLHARVWGMDSPAGPGQRWLVFDDRAMYRPGEEARVKGWRRAADLGKGGDLAIDRDAAADLPWRLADSRGNEVASGRVQLSALGGFDLALALPPTMNLGAATLAFGNPHNPDHQHSFEVQEFRRPEFEVTASASPGPHFADQPASATVRAAYYAGGGLPGAEATWQVSHGPGHFAPAGWADWSFGIQRPWWDWSGGGPDTASGSASLRGTTDGDGAHTARIELAGRPAQPVSVSAEATVMDVNRQAWTAASVLLFHPAACYAGLRAARAFVQSGERLPIELIVTDLDGRPLAYHPVTLQIVRVASAWRNRRWEREEEIVSEQVLDSGAAPLEWLFAAERGGSYLARATVSDETGRRQQSQISLWVAGGEMQQRQLGEDRVLLIPDRQSYQPGETAEILIQAPWLPAEGLLTLGRSGLLETRRFRMDGPSFTARIEIGEQHLPNLHVRVDLLGAAPRPDAAGQPDPALPPRPAFASGELNLAVPPRRRALAIALEPAHAALEPGGATSVSLAVADADGRPVAQAEVALIVVDEAILALTAYRLPDPLALFYPEREAGVVPNHSRPLVLLANDLDLDQLRELGRPQIVSRAFAMAPPSAPGGAIFEAGASFAADATAELLFLDMGGGGADAGAPIAVRSDFNPLALFVPALLTDEAGRAGAELTLPDNLTRYRVMAVAAAGERQFGTAEAAITARLPLMVRPSPPRFLNFGDRCELPVVLQNQTDQPLEVAVALRAANLALTQGAGLIASVPANNRVEVRFPVAADQAGVARFQVAAAAGAAADAAEGSFPVWTPATGEAFATYGVLDAGAIVQPVAAPPGVFPQFGGLEISQSSTALQALTDAVLYLQTYPFECAEQLSSRILAIAALRDVLQAFEAEGLPGPAAIAAGVEAGLAKLAGIQNEDGGFGFWRRDQESWPFVSIHAAHAMQRARLKGWEAPGQALERAAAYLRGIDQRIPERYGPAARQSLVAYALFVRQLMGQSASARALSLLKEAGGAAKLPLEAQGWLIPVLRSAPGGAAALAEIRAHLANQVAETAATAQFTTSYGDDAYLVLHSARRADGIVLDALIADQPESDLIPKLVRGLLGHRVAGHWGTTQDNVFVLLALDHYFATFERETPDFAARVWLGEAYAGEQRFRGRTSERRHLSIPMARLGEGEQRLALAKEGPGRLYYRIGMRYAPANLLLEPAQHGFTVERSYEAADDPGDVRRDGDGAWRIRAGARVRVRLTLVAPARRYHVALVDPLPGGLEIENGALAVTGSQPADPAAPGKGWWWRPWFQHENLRDERAEAFAPLLWEGVHAYSYVARATTPGTFVAPPSRAEEMYHPETFGRGASDTVIVE